MSKISIHALREEGDTSSGRAGTSMTDFYPRPPRGGRRLERQVIAGRRHQFLSTPSARRATRTSVKRLKPSKNFYPRPPRGGRPLRFSCSIRSFSISIHALREEGDAISIQTQSAHNAFLSTPSARRATRWFSEGDGCESISIHALREEGDRSVVEVIFDLIRFLSTPSARRATGGAQAQRAGPRDFYPRPPRGGRQQKQRQNLYFQTNYTTFCTNLEEP